jgi:hypothetical protein
MALTKEKIQEIIDHLQGSCMSLEQGCTECGIEYDDLTNEEETEFTAVLDDAIFNCESCGWWYEIGDYAVHNPNALQICSNCEEDE